MSPSLRRTVQVGLAVLASVAACIGLLLPTGARAEDTPKTYAGAAYSPELPLPPTRTENQSKLWFHADAWWGLLLEPTGRTVRVHELEPDHTWRPTPAVVNPDAGDIGDAVRDGDRVHVVNRQRDGSLYYVLLTFDPATGEYRADEPLLVTTRGSFTSATIVLDTTGRLWVAYAAVNHVVITYTDDGGRSWGQFNALANTGTGTTPELAALVAFDSSIGLLWSDQGANAFHFASHRDGDDPQAWTKERGPAGPAQADNHISLKAIAGDPSDTLVAAIKTSRGDQGEAADSVLIEVLIRAPDGQWSRTPVSTVADGLDDPVLLVDETTRTLHLFMSSRAGNIVTKRAPVDDIRFPAGLGNMFVLGPGSLLVDPTVTRDPVNARTGIVVLASSPDNQTYNHAEMAITPAKPEPDPNDVTPPTPPGNLEGRALSSDRVVLSWDEAVDGDRWVPARTGVPVQEYIVLRDGVAVARVETTSFVDDPEAGADASSVRYQVRAVDMSGNRSPAAGVTIDLPGPGASHETLIGLGLLILAGCAALFAYWRRRLARRKASRRPPPQQPRREMADSGSHPVG
jgi:hypothetical protein